MSGFNFSSLFGGFGSFGSASGFSSFNFSEYASIKNGSYRRLLKAYYAQEKADTKTKSSTTTAKDKADQEKISTENKELAKVKKSSDRMKTAAEELGKEELWEQTDGVYNVDKITSAVKNFAGEYNNVQEQSAKVGSKEISQLAGYVSSLTASTAKELEKFGITIDKDGKMNVNEDTLKNADMDQLKELFSGESSYGGQVANRAGEISSKAIMNATVYSKNGDVSRSYASMFNQWI